MGAKYFQHRETDQRYYHSNTAIHRCSTEIGESAFVADGAASPTICFMQFAEGTD